ncbi:unnamed protein product [Victoria cruziana]
MILPWVKQGKNGDSVTALEILNLICSKRAISLPTLTPFPPWLRKGRRVLNLASTCRICCPLSFCGS